MVLGSRSHRGGAVGRGDGGVAVGAQVLGEHRDDLLVVVDHQNRCHLHDLHDASARTYRHDPTV